MLFIFFYLTDGEDTEEQSHCAPSWRSEGDMKLFICLFQLTGIYFIGYHAIV
jgi:hypothetical protein